MFNIFFCSFLRSSSEVHNKSCGITPSPGFEKILQVAILSVHDIHHCSNFSLEIKVRLVLAKTLSHTVVLSNLNDLLDEFISKEQLPEY